jgi:malate dehydrogenase (quinone)
MKKRRKSMATPLPFANHSDVILVGAGIMSATLAVFLKELDPSLKIELYEVLGSAAQESSNAWNNAGTGHAALCELNYTPEDSNGSIDISKALQVNTEFDLSRQSWAYLAKKGAIKDPQSFIHPVPHFSFVRGPENRVFLKKRFEALTAHPLYYGMEYSDDAKQLAEWIPLVMEGRDSSDVVTATRMVTGTDVDYGALTKDLLDSLTGKEGFAIHFFSRVQNLHRDGDLWSVQIRDEKTGQQRNVQTKFVFLGAGGGTLPVTRPVRARTVTCSANGVAKERACWNAAFDSISST